MFSPSLKWNLLLAAICTVGLTGCLHETSNTGSNTPKPTQTANFGAKNVIFFLGDGMGIPTMTAARIYKVGEDGDLTVDTLTETAFIRTYSNDAQVTDSAPSMAAYMTGVKMNNAVISMSQDTKAIDPTNNNTTNNCEVNGPNGTPVNSILELAEAGGRSTGVVTTTRVTHATPAATYAHICHRNLEDHIAAQAVPGGTGYNSKLGDGMEVIFGGGRRQFLPNTAGGHRVDGRDLTAEFQAKGYNYVSDKASFDSLPANTSKVVGLFTGSHMSYELDRNPSLEPSLAEMTTKAMDILTKNQKGYFLMVEGGRIDHALHGTNAKRALQDTVAFDQAIKAALDKARQTDPTLKNTLIVVTADHDHTMTLNGYAKRTGPTTSSNAGILGLVKNYVTGALELDGHGMPYTILGFGNGENRVPGDRNTVAALDEVITSSNDYHQEAAIRKPPGSETHGGTDVFLGAEGAGADQFHGFMTNTEIFALLRTATGL